MWTAAGKDGFITCSQFQLTSGSAALWQLVWSKIIHTNGDFLCVCVCVSIIKLDVSKTDFLSQHGDLSKTPFVVFLRNSYGFSVQVLLAESDWPTLFFFGGGGLC